MKILVAEDDLTSRTMLQAILTKWGYDVISTSDGEEAYAAFQKDDAPQLAVLDWMMPKMDGPALCRKLNGQERQTPLYLILLTSKGESEDIVEGFESGADDYVAKPYDNAELRARINAGRRTLKLQSEIKKYAEQMETLAEEKAKQLIHAERLSSLGMLTAGVAHEINNPTTFISGNVQMLQKFWPIQEQLIKSCPKDHPEYEKLMFICDKMPETIEGIWTGTTRISTIVSGLKSFARQDTPQNSDYDIHQVIDDALLLCNNALKYNVTVEKSYFSDLPELKGDRQKIEQVFVNLFSNAADAMAGLQNGTLIIRTDRPENKITITVSDNGTGLSEKALQKIWDPFFTTKPVGKGTGLGLSISHGIIEGHGGTISVANRQEGGAEFIITLPINS